MPRGRTHTEKERASLARKGFGIPRKVLLDLGTIATPDTLLRGHRQLIVRKFDFSDRRKAGWPLTMRIITELGTYRSYTDQVVQKEAPHDARSNALGQKGLDSPDSVDGQ